MPWSNIEMLQIVAKGLSKLKNELVFVGGSITELYASNSASSDIRPTTDVDCVIEISSRMEYVRLEKKLRSLGFINDMSLNAPICRWIYNEIKVDIMPTDEKILGFSNKWYIEGIQNKINKTLPSGLEISIFSLAYYLAAKFEAHKNRGGDDLRQSHDFEDIIYIFDNNTDLLQNISKANKSVKIYLKKQCQSLIDNNNLLEGIESALPYGADIERTEMIVSMINKIAKIML